MKDDDARQYTTEEKALLRRLAVQRVFDGESPIGLAGAFEQKLTVSPSWIPPKP